VGERAKIEQELAKLNLWMAEIRDADGKLQAKGPTPAVRPGTLTASG